MADISIKVFVHHGSRFPPGGLTESKYKGETLEVYTQQDPDKISLVVVEKLLKGAGYTDVECIYYENSNGDLRVLGGDRSTLTMTDLLKQGDELHLYVQHGEKHPVGSHTLKSNNYNMYEVPWQNGETSSPTQQQIRRYLVNMK